MTKHDAVACVREFVALQEGLVHQFLNLFAPIDRERFRDVRDGEFLIGGETWRHRRHGAGVLFLGPREVRVNAHVAMSDFPGAIDGGRLYEYLESVDVDLVVFGQRGYCVTKGDMDGMLIDMAQVGVLRKIVAEGRAPRWLFELTSRGVGFSG